MKTLSMAGILGAGIFLPGGETISRAGRNGASAYCGSVANGRARYGSVNYRTGNVKRTSAYEENVYETNAHRNTVNRTIKETDANGRRSTVYGQAPGGMQMSGGSKLQA